MRYGQSTSPKRGQEARARSPAWTSHDDTGLPFAHPMRRQYPTWTRHENLSGEKPARRHPKCHLGSRRLLPYRTVGRESLPCPPFRVKRKSGTFLIGSRLVCVDSFFIEEVHHDTKKVFT